MRKIVIILILIGIAGFVFYTVRNGFAINKTSNLAVNKNGVSHPDPSNATFIFDDGPITLSRGKHEGVVAPGGVLTEETDLIDKFAYGDINGDGKNDTVLLLAQYGGGSGVFIYVAAYVSGPVNYKGSEVTFLGDRIAPQSISINGAIVTVKYLDRRPDDALAVEPTISTTKQFIYKDGEFQEVILPK